MITNYVMDPFRHSRQMFLMLGKAEIIAALMQKVESKETTQKAIAETLGVAPARISELFKGGRDLSVDEAKLLVEAYNLEDERPAQINAGLLPEPVVQQVVEAVVEYLTGDLAEGRLWSAVVVDAAKQIASGEDAIPDPQSIRQGIRFAASALAAAKPQ